MGPGSTLVWGQRPSCLGLPGAFSLLWSLPGTGSHRLRHPTPKDMMTRRRGPGRGQAEPELAIAGDVSCFQWVQQRADQLPALQIVIYSCWAFKKKRWPWVLSPIHSTMKTLVALLSLFLLELQVPLGAGWTYTGEP